jgi:exodeoxyribonuclease VII small subunit
MKKKGLNFEKALKRLEKISKEIAKKDTSLERSLELFEESIELLNYCNENLEKVSLKEAEQVAPNGEKGISSKSN